jgi:hypothetical protein
MESGDDGHIEGRSLVAGRFADGWRNIAISLIDLQGQDYPKIYLLPESPQSNGRFKTLK